MYECGQRRSPCIDNQTRVELTRLGDVIQYIRVF